MDSQSKQIKEEFANPPKNNQTFSILFRKKGKGCSAGTPKTDCMRGFYLVLQITWIKYRWISLYQDEIKSQIVL